MITPVTTDVVRRHYVNGPTAYREDGSIAKMPSDEDKEYAGKQFDQWLSTVCDSPADKARYIFSSDDLLTLSRLLWVANIAIHQPGSAAYIPQSVRERMDADVVWAAAMQNDITEQLRGIHGTGI